MTRTSSGSCTARLRRVQERRGLGPGPAYFDDDAAYDVASAAEGLAVWALSATCAQPDITALRALLAPSWTVDLVEALTEFCRLLGIGLPKA
jgi:hypothetical protein